MSGPSMGKMAKAWANRDKRSHSLSEIVSLVAMKVASWLKHKKDGKMRANRIPLILGDSGIGKSTVLRGPLVQRLTQLTGMVWEPIMWHVGTQGFEDVTGMPVIEEHDAGNGRIQKVAKFAKSEFVPGAVWRSDCTLGILDELASAPTLIQNQIREMIDGQLNGDPIDPNCFYIGTSNPPDPRFTTVNAVDAAIEKRLKVYVAVPTNEELLQVWNEIMPDMIYKFLLMNRSFIDTLSPREWHGVAQDVQDVIDGGGSLDTAIGEASDELYDRPEVEISLRKFVKFGTDPYYYPILGRDLIGADSSCHQGHIKLVERWLKDNQRGLIGETNSDLVRALHSIKVGSGNTRQATQNIFGFMELLALQDCVDMVKTSLEALFNTGTLINDVTTLMRKSNALKPLVDTVTRFHAMQEQLRNAPVAV